MDYYIGEDNMNTDKQLVDRVVKLAYEVLNDVILPMCDIEGAFADPYLASIDCYTCSIRGNEDKLEQEIVDAIIKKYNLNEYAPISGFTPLALIALIIIDKGGQYEEH